MSSLYMNTTEFAALVVNALDEQNYFKKNEKAHPGDIAIAFATVAETIGTAIGWAISQEFKFNKQQKEAYMTASNLVKSNLSAGKSKEHKYPNWEV